MPAPWRGQQGSYRPQITLDQIPLASRGDPPFYPYGCCDAYPLGFFYSRRLLALPPLAFPRGKGGTPVVRSPAMVCHFSIHQLRTRSPADFHLVCSLVSEHLSHPSATRPPAPRSRQNRARVRLRR